MKKIFKILSVLFVLLVLVVVLAVKFGISSIVAKIKPEIEKVVLEKAGAKIAFDDYSFSLLPTTELALKNIKIIEVDKTTGISISKIGLRVDPYKLLDKVVDIKEVLIQEPSIDIINDNGVKRISGFNPPKAKEVKDSSAPSSSDNGSPALGKSSGTNSPAGGAVAVTALPFALNVSKISIVNGNFTVDLPKKLVIKNFNFNVTDFDLAQKSPAKFNVSLDLDGIGSVKDSGTFLFKEIKNDKIEFAGFSGKIEGSANLIGDELALNFTGGGFSIPKIMEYLGKAPKVAVNSTVESLEFKANLNKTNPKESMKGNFNLSLGKGEITGLPIFKEIFGRSISVGGVEMSLAQFLPEQYQKYVTSENTAFDKISLKTGLIGERVEIGEIKLVSPIFNLDGKGEISKDKSIFLKNQFTLAKEVSQSLAGSKDGKYVLDENGQFIIGLDIKKTASDLKITPDLSAIAKRAAASLLKDKVGKQLDKVAPGLGNAVESLKSLF